MKKYDDIEFLIEILSIFVQIVQMINQEISLKVIIVGDTYTGKTCIMNRYINDDFDASTENTVGATTLTKELSFNDTKYILNIWDTAGQEQYHSIIPVYYRDADAAIIVFDITNPKSFDSVEYWKHSVQEEEPNCKILALCANKIDLREKSSDEIDLISPEKITETALTLGLPFFECSAATGEGIVKLFQTIFSDIISQMEPVEHTPSKPQDLTSKSQGCKC